MNIKDNFNITIEWDKRNMSKKLTITMNNWGNI